MNDALIEAAEFLLAHGSKALMAIGVVLIIWGGLSRNKRKYLVVGGLVFVLGLAWFTYEAWQARRVPIAMSYTTPSSRKALEPPPGTRSYDGKTPLHWDAPAYKNGQLTSIRYTCERPDKACGHVYPCDIDDKCMMMHKEFKTAYKPTPNIEVCSGYWEALSDGDDAVFRFDLTYKRVFNRDDSEYEKWKSDYPIVYLFVDLFPPKALCPA